LSSDNDWPLHFEARLEAHEHLLKHLIVNVLASTPDPLDAFDGFQRRLAAPLHRRVTEGPEGGDSDLTALQVKEVVDWIAKGVREDLERAANQIGLRRK
jgi:hypothetical protein